MIVGVGCDIIEVDRIRQALAKAPVKLRIYTPAEISYCESKGVAADISFAGRFAAKEAVLKALGTGLRGGKLQEIEILSGALGRPQVFLHGHFADIAAEIGIKKIHLSVSHIDKTAMAYAVMEA